MAWAESASIIVTRIGGGIVLASISATAAARGGSIGRGRRAVFGQVAGTEAIRAARASQCDPVAVRPGFARPAAQRADRHHLDVWRTDLLFAFGQAADGEVSMP